MVTFDPEKHEYRRDGVLTLSVTQVLTAAGLIKKAFYTAAGRDRGTAVHEATEVMDSLDLAPEDFDPEIHGYLLAWNRFKRESGVEILEVESLVDNPELDYAGKLDRLVMLKDGTILVLDIKTGSKSDWHRLQVAGYALPRKEAKGGMVVYLGKEGKYTTQVRSGQDFRLDTIEWIRTVKSVKEGKNVA